MGRDAMSVVDGVLKVFGVDALRITDASILARVTTGNMTAPCVVISELAAAQAVAKSDDDRRLIKSLRTIHEQRILTPLKGR
jgi:choline dehydrogenase-like flavoprotein